MGMVGASWADQLVTALEADLDAGLAVGSESARLGVWSPKVLADTGDAEQAFSLVQAYTVDRVVRRMTSRERRFRTLAGAN